MQNNNMWLKGPDKSIGSDKKYISWIVNIKHL